MKLFGRFNKKITLLGTQTARNGSFESILSLVEIRGMSIIKSLDFSIVGKEKTFFSNFLGKNPGKKDHFLFLFRLVNLIYLE